VRRIAVCPGGLFPLMVATSTEILGSPDDGMNWVRLLRVPGRVPVTNIVCDPQNTAHIIVTTGFGMFRSNDGGLSFDQDFSGWPGRRATAVAVRSNVDSGESEVFVATGHVLFGGNPDSDVGLSNLYPDFNNSETAPWTTIRWIDFAGEQVWIGTNDGARMSADGGRSWRNVAPNLFSRQIIAQVAAGANEIGGPRIALLTRDCPNPRAQRSGSGRGCRTSRVYATDDGGHTWFPFFSGITRRTIQQIVSAPALPGADPRWWIVTGGELWATVQPGPAVEGVDQASARWAQRELSITPSMSVLIEAILEEIDLSNEAIENVAWRASRRYYMPRIDARLSIYDDSDQRTETSRAAGGGADELRLEESTGGVNYGFFAYATWYLDRIPLVSEEYGSSRRDLYFLQRQVKFIVEDAWHERNLHLTRIARGMNDRLQVEILRERIAALDVVLEAWLREPMETLLREEGASR